MKRVFSVLLILSLFLALTPATGEESGLASEDYESLCALAEGYGFKLGTCFSYDHLRNKKYLEIVSRHFNSLTCCNETKAYSMLDEKASRNSDDGMPCMNYAYADKMLKYASENGIAVRGHTLVWDAYMTPWFFHENYDMNQPIADRETMRARVKSYIEQVITHFETKFPGLIYCWDVVNEAIGDSITEYVPGDARHIRITRNGERNPFYDYVGEDYVEYAFLCARDAVDALGADIKLFYNDYNMFYAEKRSAACCLIESINSYQSDENGTPRKLIDGVGMQGYIGGYGTQQGCLRGSDIDSIRNSIHAYASCGMEVQLTEMAVRNYEKTEAAAHAQFYAALMRMLMEVNSSEEGNPLTAVCIWGLCDCPNLPASNYTWKLNSPYGGLITEKYKIKTSFDAVYHALKGE